MSETSREFPEEPVGSKEKKPIYECSQYLLIDEREGESRCTYFGKDSSQEACDSSEEREEGAPPTKEPLSLRFACVLGLVFCSIFGFGILLWAIVMTCFATGGLFRNKERNKDVASLWKIFANTAIAGFCFILGMINPAFGLSLIAVYFSLSSNSMNDDILSQVIRRSFN